MQKHVQFQLEEAIEIPKWADAYPENKFTVFKTCFLSTKPNSHELKISAEVLQKYAKTILGNFLVAKLEFGDATTHKDSEIIYGYFPMEQEIEFVEEDEVTKAYAYAVVSRRYSKEFNGIFEFDNLRNSSVEMTVGTSDEDENEVLSLDIYGLTCLGKTVNGSCPDADIQMVRFAQDEAEDYFKGSYTLSMLQQFVKERNQNMAQSYKIDKSKEAMSDADWGDVDKAEMRKKIVEAENVKELVKDVYALVEDGWEEAPSEHLKYPLMELKGDTFVYNRGALSSALAYAKQHDETAVVNKVEEIYRKLDIDDSDGKEEKEMSEIEFTVVSIDDLWCRVYQEMEAKHEYMYGIHGIYEEDGQKFAILCDRARKLYRLDFFLTEEGLTLADEIKEVVEEFIETDNMVKFAEPENVEIYRTFAEQKESEEDEPEEKADGEEQEAEEKEEIAMADDEMMSTIAKLEAIVEEKENIIMEKDKAIESYTAELEELRKFKADVEMKEQATVVENVMKNYEKYFEKATADALRAEGLEVKMSELDGWTNKVKASVVDKVTKVEDKSGIFSFSAPVTHSKKSDSESVWDRL